ncbi:MAG: avidin/streptavidin family protein [Sphingomonas taxi]
MKHEQALALALAGGEQGFAPASSPLIDASATWVNELGSTAQFNFGAGGVLTGTYTSNVSTGGGSISGPITGWYSQNAIAWSVAWPTNPPAITSWTGEAVRAASGYVIETLWYMVTQTANPGDPTQFWTAVNAGADTFTPQ